MTYLPELLKAINDDVSLLKTVYARKAPDSLLERIFHVAFRPELKFRLPPGDPPFKPTAEPLGLTPSNIMREMRRMYIFVDPNISQLKREQIFIEMLESVHPSEAKILLAIKDQNLPSLYPNITRGVLLEAGYIPPLTPDQIVQIDEPEVKPVKEKKAKPVLTCPHCGKEGTSHNMYRYHFDKCKKKGD